MSRLYHILIIITLWLVAVSSSAEIHYDKLWLALNLDGPLAKDSRFKFYFNPELRLVDAGNHFEVAQTQAGLGYQFVPNATFWAGYQVFSHNNLSGSARENRIWQQITWNILTTSKVKILSRSRFEERHRVTEPQWSDRFRERLTLRLPSAIAPKITPAIWDELFFNVNRAPWTVQRTFEQNRAFIGLDFTTSKESFLEVGYLNQYIFSNRVNEDNHILYVMLNVSLS